jgi:hypothetical protein
MNSYHNNKIEMFGVTDLGSMVIYCKYYYKTGQYSDIVETLPSPTTKSTKLDNVINEIKETYICAFKHILE